MNVLSEEGTAIPAIGRIVHYRSRTGNYTVPAIITATKDTLYRPGVEGGFVPDLDSPFHVHLTVFTPGQPGKRTDAKDFVARQDEPISENVAGCYQEWNVPFSVAHDPGDDAIAAGCWSWPPRS